VRERSRISIAAAVLLAVACQPAARDGAASAAAEQAVFRVLDDWHAAAAAADEERYFSHFAPDGVFLGTDPAERWTVDDFRAYAHPYFSQGRGWTYVPADRHVRLSDDLALAWFDERLVNEKYGTLRGTGVLRATDAGWKLVHYSMSFSVPNDATPRVVEVIRQAGPAGE
jgi:uncharacterized protein (TIGR02246 family)